jgi:hypothetical protein
MTCDQAYAHPGYASCKSKLPNNWLGEEKPK